MDTNSKKVDTGILLDFYGELISENQRNALDLYCNEDLSLAEIAELTGLTRAGVHDRIVKGERALRDFEEKLGLARSRTTVEYIIRRLNELRPLCGEDTADILAAAESLL